MISCSSSNFRHHEEQLFRQDTWIVLPLTSVALSSGPNCDTCRGGWGWAWACDSNASASLFSWTTGKGCSHYDKEDSSAKKEISPGSQATNKGVCVCVYICTYVQESGSGLGRNLYLINGWVVILYNRPQGSVFPGVSWNEFQDEKVTNSIMGRTMKFFIFFIFCTILKPEDPLVIWIMLMHSWF